MMMGPGNVPAETMYLPPQSENGDNFSRMPSWVCLRFQFPFRPRNHIQSRNCSLSRLASTTSINSVLGCKYGTTAARALVRCSKA